MPKKAKAWEVRARDAVDLAACGEIVHFATFFDDKFGGVPEEPESPLVAGSESGSPTKKPQRPTTATSVLSAGSATAGDVVGYADKFGYTALHVAVVHGQYAVAKILLDNGADVDARTDAGVTPLHCAAEQGHLRLAELLLEYGADTTFYTDRYELALQSAREGCFSEIVVLLEPIVRSKSTSEDVLVAAAKGDMLYLLLALYDGHGRADALSATTDAGDNALHVVCKVGKLDEGHLEVVKFLVTQHLVDTNALNGQRMSALMYAARAVNLPLLRLLLANGADATLSSDEKDGSRTASSYTNNEHLRMLLDEAERRCEFETLYAERNSVPFTERADFIANAKALKARWDEAAANHKVYCQDAHVEYVRP
jgi:ankyrin repeat protein